MSSTINKILQSSCLDNSSINKRDIENCLLDIIGKTKTFLIRTPEYKISPYELKCFKRSIELLNNGVPLAYIIGNQDFYGYKYFVDSNVLIPRTETEIIIPEVLKQGDLLYKKNKKLKLIDAGTGSGCIGLTIARERPDWDIVLIDNSLESIKTLQKNYNNRLHDNCRIVISNWLRGLKKNIADIIISNPPYIEYKSKYLDENVFKHEPHYALFAHEKGLQDIKILISQSKSILMKKGILFIENGFDQSREIVKLLKQNYYEDIDIILDYNGIKRFTVSRNS